MEWLNNAWNVVAPYLSGITLGGVLSAIFYALLKAGFTKTINKIDVEKIAKTATDKGVDRVKEISFKQSIQPLVESELRKVTEEANKYIEKELKEVKDEYQKIIDILEKQAQYFDNAIGVPQKTKDELKEAIKVARGEQLNDTEEIQVAFNEKEQIVAEKVETASEEQEQVDEKPKKKRSVR